VGVVSNGCDGTPLNSSYKNRFSNKYMNSLGHTLVNFSRIIPDGMLVFFPSYSVMETTLTHWRDTAILSQIERHKQVFKEPRRKTDLKHVMEAYREQIYNTDSASAAFFAVCRGKVSEGLDFADCNGRAVIITGLPYPPREDPKVCS
jgi:regulator of telomere elongation helicase 1